MLENGSAPRSLITLEDVRLSAGYVTEDAQHGAPEKSSPDEEHDGCIANEPEEWILRHQALDQRRHERLT
jgi:hypothetical protein